MLKQNAFLVFLFTGLLFSGVYGNAATYAGHACGLIKPACPDGDFVAEVYQLDLNFDENLVEDSAWGMADITFIGSEDLLYFNLVRDGQWLIQNFPVLSSQGANELQTLSFNFDLGVPDGFDVFETELAMSLLPFVSVDAPDVQIPQVVVPRTYSINSGHQGVAIQAQAASGMVMIGGPAVKGEIVGPSIVNQNCGENECVPAAVSNALMYLNQRFNLGINPNLITIAALKPALGFTTGGCPLPDGNFRGGWPQLKRDYLQTHGIRIKTSVVGPKRINQVIKALKKGCVVEMNAGSHTVLVTGVAKQRAAHKYTIEVAHDTEQAEAGGTTFETFGYDKRNASLTGCSWATSVHSFVIECKK